MKDGLYDKVALKMQRIVGRATGKLDIEFRNKRPFDKVPVPPEEQIMDYMDYVENPDIEQEFLQQGADPMTIQKYHDDMHKLINEKVMRSGRL